MDVATGGVDGGVFGTAGGSTCGGGGDDATGVEVVLLCNWWCNWCY